MYTKGDWKVFIDEDQLEAGKPYDCIEVRVGGSELLTLYIDRNNTDEQLANAQLIASAPDLYEAIKRAVDSADNYTWHYEKNQRIFLELARVALSKAEGKT